MTNTQTILIVLVLLFAVLFGWYAVRPAHIRQDCAALASKTTTDGVSYDRDFALCLSDHGLER